MSNLLILFCVWDSPNEPQTGMNIRLFLGPAARQKRGQAGYRHRSFCSERSAALSARACAEIPYGGWAVVMPTCQSDDRQATSSGRNGRNEWGTID
jgi:hypothetical protein